jgi:hypothetical protein
MSSPIITAAGTSWVGDLAYEDLQRLRSIVRRTHLHFYPAEKVTPAECDKLIEAIGPKVAEEMIQRAVDGGRARAKSHHQVRGLIIP